MGRRANMARGATWDNRCSILSEPTACHDPPPAFPSPAEMCGIAGTVLLGEGRIDQFHLHAQTRCLAHRGPDGEGTWINPGGHVGLGHRRLAIVDLSPAAGQPMSYSDRYMITYNGELYNYVELREELCRRGCRFRTSSDTEVVLAAYAEYGPDCLRRFDGMFAFALWDEGEQTLFCARDRLGEKPFFYWYEPGRRFVFASEVKALFAAGVDPAVDERQLFNYLAYDVVQDPARPADTFYRGVRSLEPAHTLTIGRDGAPPTARRYWQIDSAAPPSTQSLPEAAQKLRDLLEQSIRRRLRSDVALGTSLSGGLDSSTIVCLLSEMAGPGGHALNTFSARFADPRLDEGRHIQTVVEWAGVTSHQTWPDGQGLADDLDRLFFHQEEPFGSASIYAQWKVMQLAKEAGTIVLLDGQGPDEMLAGYRHFVVPHLRGLYRTDRPEFRREVRHVDASLRASLGWRFRLGAIAPRLYRRLGALRRAMVPQAGPRWLSPEFARASAGAEPPFRAPDDLSAALRFFTQDYGLRTLLRYADRNSMAFGREVRLPFLSHELMEFLFVLPDAYKLGQGVTKLVLREAVSGVVPDSIRSRTDKIGFDTPQDDWLAHPALRDRVAAAAETLARERILATHVVPEDGAWRVLMAALLLRSAGAGRLGR